MEIIDPKPAGDPTAQTSARQSEGAGNPSQPDQQKPDNFLPWAILSTIFCCLPFGIVAIVYSTQVDSYWYAGNYEGSRLAAKRARTWTWVSVGVAVACWVIYLLLAVVLGVLSYSSMSLIDL